MNKKRMMPSRISLRLNSLSFLRGTGVRDGLLAGAAFDFRFIGQISKIINQENSCKQKKQLNELLLMKCG